MKYNDFRFSYSRSEATLLQMKNNSIITVVLSLSVTDVSGTTHITYAQPISDSSHICIRSFQFSSHFQSLTQISLHSALRPSPDRMGVCSAHLASTAQMSGEFNPYLRQLSVNRMWGL